MSKEKPIDFSEIKYKTLREEVAKGNGHFSNVTMFVNYTVYTSDDIRQIFSNSIDELKKEIRDGKNHNAGEFYDAWRKAKIEECERFKRSLEKKNE